MPLLMEASAEADLLLIDELEIEPLPDRLIVAESPNTSDSPSCCSCEFCSSGTGQEPPPPKECQLFSLIWG
jgi:hypothetical protein